MRTLDAFLSCKRFLKVFATKLNLKKIPLLPMKPQKFLLKASNFGKKIKKFGDNWKNLIT